MNTFFKALTLSLAIFSVSTVSAAPAPQKVGVVFPTKIMKESPQRQRIIKKLESEFKDRYLALQKLEKELQGLEKKLKRDAELMSKKDLAEKQHEIQVKVSDYKFKRKAFEEDNRRRQGEEQQKALVVVRDVINKVALDGNYDLILNGDQIIFAKPAYDISDIVIKEISKK